VRASERGRENERDGAGERESTKEEGGSKRERVGAGERVRTICMCVCTCVHACARVRQGDDVRVRACIAFVLHARGPVCIRVYTHKYIHMCI